MASKRLGARLGLSICGNFIAIENKGQKSSTSVTLRPRLCPFPHSLSMPVVPQQDHMCTGPTGNNKRIHSCRDGRKRSHQDTGDMIKTQTCSASPLPAATTATEMLLVMAWEVVGLSEWQTRKRYLNHQEYLSMKNAPIDGLKAVFWKISQRDTSSNINTSMHKMLRHLAA